MRFLRKYLSFNIVIVVLLTFSLPIYASESTPVESKSRIKKCLPIVLPLFKTAFYSGVAAFLILVLKVVIIEADPLGNVEMSGNSSGNRGVKKTGMVNAKKMLAALSVFHLFYSLDQVIDAVWDCGFGQIPDTIP